MGDYSRCRRTSGVDAQINDIGTGNCQSLYRLSLCGLHRQPRKKDQTKITSTEIDEVKGAVGKTTLRQLFDSDQEGKCQAAEHGNPVPTPGGIHSKESQVDEKSQDPIQNEMSEFIRKGNVVNDGENPEICLC